jgi:RNA polymerase sigma-70 factor, ECF subfamily
MDHSGREQFRQKLNELYPRLLRAMTAYLAGSTLDPEDIVQETFLKAYSNIDSFEGKSGFYTWIYSIARNLCIDEFRKRKYDHLQHSVPSDELEIASDTFSDMEKKEEILMLRKAIAMLPELFRSVVVMKTIDGMSYPEISEITGINEETLKNRMFRARKELAKTMKMLGAEP